MPTVQENARIWSEYGWESKGDEWSQPWGGSDAMWHASLLPRLRFFLPARHILEIAPGHGRLTKYLLPHCDRYTGIDLVQRCVEACRLRFAPEPKAAFFQNDGYSLAMVPDGSVDLACSYASLVHARADVMESYVRQLATKLRPGGFGFIHHSNLGAHADAATGELTVPNERARGADMSAALLRRYCQSAGLRCLTQELIAWWEDQVADCYSVFVRPAPGVRYPDCAIAEFKGIDSEARNAVWVQRMFDPAARPA